MFQDERNLRPTRHRHWGTALTLWLAVLLLPCLASGDGHAKVSPARVEAAFLRNFAHYLTWPAAAFPDGQAPWRICILGTDPFGEVLEETFRGRAEHGRTFAITRAATTAELPACHVVYIGHRARESRRAALADLANRPVLTVSDAPGFLQEGGMIRFKVSDRVEFGINLDSTNAAALRIPAKVLEVAHEVIENGTARKRR